LVLALPALLLELLLVSAEFPLPLVPVPALPDALFVAVLCEFVAVVRDELLCPEEVPYDPLPLAPELPEL